MLDTTQASTKELTLKVKSLQSYIEEFNEELGKKINKDEIQFATEEDIENMLDEIFGDNGDNKVES